MIVQGWIALNQINHVKQQNPTFVYDWFFLNFQRVQAHFVSKSIPSSRFDVRECCRAATPSAGCRSSTAMVSSRRKHRAALLVMPSVADLSGERSRRARPPSARWTCSCARLLAHTTLHVVLAATQACSTTFYSIWSLERAERGAVAMACGLHGLGRHEAAVWGLMRASVRSSPMQFTKYDKVK